jgi:hypothetical protein
MINRDKVCDLIDDLLAAKGHAVRMDINASRCGTRTDWKNANESELRLEELKEKTIFDLLQMIEGR